VWERQRIEWWSDADPVSECVNGGREYDVLAR
jgi:hypothetical protein